MINATFDASFKALLQAFNAHQDLRRQGADITTLARSNHELHQARMHMYHATR